MLNCAAKSYDGFGMRLVIVGLLIGVIASLVWLGLGGLLTSFNVWDPSRSDFKDYLLFGVFIIFPLALGIPIVVLLSRKKRNSIRRGSDPD